MLLLKTYNDSDPEGIRLATQQQNDLLQNIEYRDNMLEIHFMWGNS